MTKVLVILDNQTLLEASLEMLSIELGADDYLTKSFSRDELLTKMHKRLDRITNISHW